MITIMRFV